MSAETVIYLLALASGAFLTLSLQAHRKAQKAVKEAQEAVENAKAVHVDTNVALARSQAANDARITEQAEQLTQRMHKLEIRLEDVTNRVASLQIKR